MIPEVIALAVLVGWLMKGDPRRLADVQLTHSWLIYGAFGSFVVAQLIARGTEFAGKSSLVFVLLHIVSILFFLALAYANRQIPGVWLILIGLGLNAIAIAANGGFMPATAKALAIVMGPDYLEEARTVVSVKHCIADSHTKLLFLTDIIPIPQPYLLLKGVFSIGDMIMTSGICVAIISIMRHPLPNEKPVLEEA